MSHTKIAVIAVSAITLRVLFGSPIYWIKQALRLKRQAKRTKYARQIELMDKYKCTFCGKKPDACWCQEKQMEKHIVRLTQTTVWEVEVEAKDANAALELTRDWGRDELGEDDIVSNVWETEV